MFSTMRPSMPRRTPRRRYEPRFPKVRDPLLHRMIQVVPYFDPLLTFQDRTVLYIGCKVKGI